MGFLSKQNPAPPNMPNAALFEGVEYTRTGNTYTRAKVNVDEQSAKSIATAYRCSNIISDDIAMMPLQQFYRLDGRVAHVSPDPITRNMPYLMEVQPNRWMTPFIFKKTAINWLIFWGDCYIWEPPQAYRELFLLNSSVTTPKLNAQGNKVYETIFPNGQRKTLPDTEVMHLMINSKNGRKGRSVLEFARETFGNQIAAKQTQSDIQGNGLKASAYIKVNATLDKDGRQIIKDAYSESLEEPGGLAVFDNKVAEFNTITMKATDMQFIEGMNVTETDIINFFGVPEYKLNRGKQSYQSNGQQDLDYLKTTLDSYLVQWEQAARLKWVFLSEQTFTYWKFIRESILRTDSKTRAELHEIKIRSGQMNPNEAREVEDMSAYELGEKFYMTSNYQEIEKFGEQKPNDKPQ